MACSRAKKAASTVSWGVRAGEAVRIIATMHKTSCDTIIDAAWVLPIAPVNEALSRHSVCIQNERICAIGPTRDIHERYTAPALHSFNDSIVMPGLINGHTHAAMTLLRGAGEDMPLESWLRTCIWPLEKQLVDPDFVTAGVELAIVEMLGHGITTFTDMYFFPEITARVARAANIRTIAAFPIFDAQNAWSRNVDECFELGFRLHDEYAQDPLVSVAFGPHAPYSVDYKTLERVHMYAQELGLNVHTHLHETATEVTAAKAKHGRSWIAVLADIGLVNPQLQAVHMTQLDDAEIELLAANGAHVVHCPNSNLKLADGVCPVNRLDASGINVAIGTDGAASNNTLSVLSDARTAALLAKMQAENPVAGNARQTLLKATLGGARALGREHELGTLEPGKLADIAVFSPASLCALPVYDPFASLLHNSAAWRADNVWVHGRSSMANGLPVHLDLAAIRARVNFQATRVRALLQENH